MADGLDVRNVSIAYGGPPIVHDVSFTLEPRRTLALLGRNGAGKTTTINGIAGRVRLRSGEVHVDGDRIDAWTPSARCRRGVGFVPQDRQIFRSLTVDEHLRVGGSIGGNSVASGVAGAADAREMAYGLFPRLAERRDVYGDRLSGGEQQMLAIARALVGQPRYLLLDEPFEGLAPVVVDGLLAALIRLRDEIGVSMLIVEHHARLVVEMADAGLVMERGGIRLAGSREELLGRWSEVEELLAVSDDRAR